MSQFLLIKKKKNNLERVDLIVQFMYLNYPKHRGQWAQWSFQVTVKALLTILTIDERKRGSIVVEVAVVVTEAVAAAVVRFLLFLQSIDLSYKSWHGLEG